MFRGSSCWKAKTAPAVNCDKKTETDPAIKNTIKKTLIHAIAFPAQSVPYLIQMIAEPIALKSMIQKPMAFTNKQHKNRPSATRLNKKSLATIKKKSTAPADHSANHSTNQPASQPTNQPTGGKVSQFDGQSPSQPNIAS